MQTNRLSSVRLFLGQDRLPEARIVDRLLNTFLEQVDGHPHRLVDSRNELFPVLTLAISAFASRLVDEYKDLHDSLFDKAHAICIELLFTSEKYFHPSLGKALHILALDCFEVGSGLKGSNLLDMVLSNMLLFPVPSQRGKLLWTCFTMGYSDGYVVEVAYNFHAHYDRFDPDRFDTGRRDCHERVWIIWRDILDALRSEDSIELTKMGEYLVQIRQEIFNVRDKPARLGFYTYLLWSMGLLHCCRATGQSDQVVQLSADISRSLQNRELYQPCAFVAYCVFTSTMGLLLNGAGPDHRGLIETNWSLLRSMATRIWAAWACCWEIRCYKLRGEDYKLPKRYTRGEYGPSLRYRESRAQTALKRAALLPPERPFPHQNLLHGVEQPSRSDTTCECAPRNLFQTVYLFLCPSFT